MKEKLAQAVEFLRRRLEGPYRLGCVLGSGLGSAAAFTPRRVIPYREIPHFPVPTVQGHEGELAAGTWNRRRVLVLKGRCHGYEGYSLREVAFPIHVLAALGVRTLLLANAAGGIRRDLIPGTLMLVEDHINLMGGNPLAGLPGEGRERFVDMGRAYDPRLLALAASAARRHGLRVRRGVLAAVLGPTYETPAEIRMLKTLGAHAVAMSTVPEVIAARYLGMRVLAVSLITNRAAGLGRGGVSHAEVLRRAGEAAAGLSRFLAELVQQAGESAET